MKFILNINQTTNFSFEACLAFLNRGYDECLYHVSQNYVRRLIRISSGLILIQISSDDDNLKVLANRNTTAYENEEIKQYVNDWFDINRDISGFYKLIDSHNETKDFSCHYYGLRLIGIVDLFEALCWCVIGQQINLTFAHKIKTRLVHQFGDHFEYDGIVYHCFPTPQCLNEFHREDLVNMQFSKQKIAYIKNISQAFCDGDLNKSDLLKLTNQQQMDKLLSIKGIGPWTANYASMKSLRNMNCIAYGDTGLSSALHSIFKTEKKPNKTTIDKIFQPYTGWESYFNFYLWKSLS